VAQFFGEEGPKFYAPFAEGLVADLNAALMKQFLDVSVTEGEAMVEPNRVLDDADRKTMAIRFWVSHNRSAYPDPTKATQPFKVLK
jgi:hypothetical protein